MLNLLLAGNYIIEFNDQYIPFDFDKWRKLDTKECNENKLLLDKYRSVIIKSMNSNILLQMGGTDYVIKHNTFYFPFLNNFHQCYIMLCPGIDIFINDELASPFETNNNAGELYKLMMKMMTHISFDFLNRTVFSGGKINYQNRGNIGQIEDNYNLHMAHGMYSIMNVKYIPVDIGEFYCDYQTINKKLNVDDEKIIDDINLIDKYYQLGAIKFCEFVRI